MAEAKAGRLSVRVEGSKVGSTTEGVSAGAGGRIGASESVHPRPFAAGTADSEEAACRAIGRRSRAGGASAMGDPTGECRRREWMGRSSEAYEVAEEGAVEADRAWRECVEAVLGLKLDADLPCDPREVLRASDPMGTGRSLRGGRLGRTKVGEMEGDLQAPEDRREPGGEVDESGFDALEALLADPLNSRGRGPPPLQLFSIAGAPSGVKGAGEVGRRSPKRGGVKGVSEGLPSRRGPRSAWPDAMRRPLAPETVSLSLAMRSGACSAS